MQGNAGGCMWCFRPSSIKVTNLTTIDQQIVESQ